MNNIFFLLHVPFNSLQAADEESTPASAKEDAYAMNV